MITRTFPRPSFHDKVCLRVGGSEVPAKVRWSFFLFLFTLPFEAVDLPFLTGSLSLTKISGLLFATTYFFYFNPVVKVRPLPSVPLAMSWFLGYFAIYTFSAFALTNDHLPVFLSIGLTRLQLLVLFWIMSDVLRDKGVPTYACIIVVLASILLSIGIWFNLFAVPADTLQETMTAFGNSNTLAGVLALAFVAAIGLLLTRVFKTFTVNTLLVLSLLPLLKIMVATGSRSGIGTAVIGCLVYVLSFARTRRKFVTIAVLVIGLSASLYLGRQDSVLVERWQKAYYDYELSGRTEIYPAAIEMFLERPGFGWGPVNDSYELGRRLGYGGPRGQHNLVLTLLVEVGLIGTTAFFIGVWLIVRCAWKARNGILGYLPIALLIAVGANTMVENGLDPRTKVFWLVLALALSATPARMKQNAIRLKARRN